MYGQFCSLQIVLERRSDCVTEHLHLLSDDAIIRGGEDKIKQGDRISAAKLVTNDDDQGFVVT